MSYNYYDTELKCGGSGVNIIIKLVYILVWCIALPILVVLKSPREYIIEYVGYMIKILLVIVAKLSKGSPVGGVLATLLVLVQFVVFLFFKEKQ